MSNKIEAPIVKLFIKHPKYNSLILCSSRVFEMNLKIVTVERSDIKISRNLNLNGSHSMDKTTDPAKARPVFENEEYAIDISILHAVIP